MRPPVVQLQWLPQLKSKITTDFFILFLFELHISDFKRLGESEVETCSTFWSKVCFPLWLAIMSPRDWTQKHKPYIKIHANRTTETMLATQLNVNHNVVMLCQLPEPLTTQPGLLGFNKGSVRKVIWTLVRWSETWSLKPHWCYTVYQHSCKGYREPWGSWRIKNGHTSCGSSVGTVTQIKKYK